MQGIPGVLRLFFPTVDECLDLCGEAGKIPVRPLLAPLRDEQQPLCRGDERVKDALLARCALFGDGPAGREGGEPPGRQIELRA